MPTARHRPAADGRACTGIALGALVLTAAPDAAADGEKTPMFGGAIVGALGSEPRAAIVGVELEAAWWHGRFGLGLEGSMHWDIEGAGARATVLGASARVRVLDALLPSLLEPRDVELGLELHGIVERTWWDGALSDGALSEASPIGYGLGLAVRLRGGADQDFSSTLLAESRLFVRVLSSHRTAAEAVARTMAPAEDEPRELTILIGIGAAFGGGEPRYVDRFRLHPFDSMTPWFAPTGDAR